MRPYWRYFLLYVPFVVVAFLTVPFGKRHAFPLPESLPLDQWDISQLTAYLNKAGVQVQAQATQKDGILGQSAYLTATPKNWHDLNGLIKDPKRIRQWQGIVYCAIETPNAAADLAHQWGDHGLLVGRFVFYGDAELLSRINVALSRPAPADAP